MSEKYILYSSNDDSTFEDIKNHPGYKVNRKGVVIAPSGKVLTVTKRGCVNINGHMRLVGTIVATQFVQNPNNGKKARPIDGNIHNTNTSNWSWDVAGPVGNAFTLSEITRCFMTMVRCVEKTSLSDEQISSKYQIKLWFVVKLRHVIFWMKMQGFPVTVDEYLGEMFPIRYNGKELPGHGINKYGILSGFHDKETPSTRQSMG